MSESHDSVFDLWAKMRKHTGKSTDLTDLPVFLEYENWKRDYAARIDQDERRHDAEGRVRVGSERTYWDLAMAMELLHEEVEAELTMDGIPVLPGEDETAANKRINDLIVEQLGQDERMHQLLERWSGSFREAYRRYYAFLERQKAALAERGVSTTFSPSVELAWRQDAGLEELLPGIDDG